MMRQADKFEVLLPSSILKSQAQLLSSPTSGKLAFILTSLGLVNIGLFPQTLSYMCLLNAR